MHNHLSIERKFLISVLVLLFIAPVFADHTASVTINPDIANCNELGNTFTVTIENDASSYDKLIQVEIPRYLPGISSLSCGPAPTGWFLTTPITDRCIYITEENSSYKLLPGNSLNFTFNATMNSGSCNSTFNIVTVDDAKPQGDRDTDPVVVYIDCSLPQITKTVGDPKLLGDGFDWWITQNTQIDITGSDSKDTCDLGMDYCRWRYRVDNSSWSEWETHNSSCGGDVEFSFSFEEDSVHDIQIECYDIAGNKATLEETDKVDSTPPETNKTYGMPFYSDGTYDWITNSTPIDLTATDGGNICAIGVDKLYYRVTQLNVPDSECIAACDFNGVGGLNETDENHIQFNIGEDSCHLIEFYAVDKLGNTEEINKQCVFVDNKPPVGTKTIGEPKRECGEGEDCNYWVSQNTSITLTCTDQQPHPVDNEKVCYKIYVDNNDKTNDYCDHNLNSEGYCCENKTHTLKFKEDSNHTLEYYCEDALGNRNEVDIEYFKVDSQPPVITKTMIGDDHLGNCPPTNPEDICYVKDDGKNGVHIDVKDNQTYLECVIGVDYCNYGLWWYTDETTCKKKYGDDAWDGYKCLVDSGSFGEEGKDIYFTEDSTHDLYISCWDLLGNQMPIDVETFKVDSTPPVTTKRYGDPTVVVSEGYRWITSTTPITLTATDEKIGVDKIYYRVTYIGDGMCPEVCDETGSGNWTEISNDTTEFTINEDSCHLIEFYSIDKFGNEEIHHKQCVMVDNTPPDVWKNIGEPQVNKSGKIYITQNTPVSIHCKDEGDHPVGEDKIFYRYRISDDCQNWGNWTEWFDPGATKKIYFSEDSCHELEYYCVDKLGNKADTQSEIDIVDTQSPEISTSVIGHHYESDGKLYIDGVTKIHVEATDPDPHPVDDVKCEWWYYVNDDTTPIQGGSDLTPPFNISFPEESKHDLWIRCWDALGNNNETHEVYYVDHTPPITTNTYGEPYFSTCTSQWITSDTNITLTATDGTSIHASGVNKTWYRDIYLENESDWHYCYSDCNAWTDDERATVWGLPTAPEPYNPSSRGFVLYEKPFTLPNESCHIIEYYSYDNVGKVEQVKHQCVFVDNTPPEPNKTVGEPKTHCEGEECETWEWKITTMTPITLSCEDKGPHPVDNSIVYWRIWWDYNGNWTEWYNATEGTEIYLEEKCLHQLEFYCVDALGHESEHDIEKIKVEGTSFNIQLNKKWNLISVPFVMLDDSIDEVFKDIANETEAVWTYDPENEICDEEWCVYTPGEGPDTLDEMTPGWGYWVLAKKDTQLVIGGSLFTPKKTFPERKLVPGWNLIGYYGTDGLLSYNGPNGKGKVVYEALDSLLDKYWVPFLNETMIISPKWSKLITYWQKGINISERCDPSDPLWKCLGEKDHMDPGAGYWILMKEGDGEIY